MPGRRLWEGTERKPYGGAEVVPTMSAQAADLPELLRVCAWCKRVKLKRWLPLRTALRYMGRTNVEGTGSISHGICDDCFALVTQRSAGADADVGAFGPATA